MISCQSAKLFFMGLLICGVAVISCRKELRLPDIRATEQLVLLGEIRAGDSISLRAGSSIPVAKGSPMHFRMPGTLQISLTGRNGQVISLHPREDRWMQQLSSVLYAGGGRAEAGEAYYLVARKEDGEEASCRVSVPMPFNVRIADTASVWVNGLNLLRVRIEIADHPATTDYYAVECIKEYMDIDGRFRFEGRDFRVSESHQLYDSLRLADTAFIVHWDTVRPGNSGRMYVFTDDERTENLRISNAQSASKRILLSDRTINGQVYTLQVYIDRSGFVSEGQGKGIVNLQVKSVSEDYFNYLKGYEHFEATSDFNSLAQPVLIPGNLQNGLGMVGGVYLHQFRYLFDRWY